MSEIEWSEVLIYLTQSIVEIMSQGRKTSVKRYEYPQGVEDKKWCGDKEMATTIQKICEGLK
jgi:hypothetical protein